MFRLPPLLFLQECFLVDEEAGQLRWRVRPDHHFSSSTGVKRFNEKHAENVAGQIWSYKDNIKYIFVNLMIDGKPTRLHAHRIIYVLHHGFMNDPFVKVIHLNEDTLDNRPVNLISAE